MTLHTCSRQPEVLAMQTHGHWPQACPPDLRAHLEACASCKQLLVVTHAFQQARAATAAQAQLPAPGLIWWRAQLRRRNAAVERIGRPIVAAYIFALAIAVLAAAGTLISQAHRGLLWLDWLMQAGNATLHLQPLSHSDIFTSGWGILAVIPAFAAIAFVGAVVVYWATERQ
jgi:hypothetical protein